MLNRFRFPLLAILAMNFTFSAFAQEVKRCGIHEATIRTFGLTPERLQNQSGADAQLERETEAYLVSGSAERAELLTIPVVFHVIHNNGPENIATEQIHDALEVVNRDFNALNLDIDEVVPAFSPIVGDVEIQFKLARKDPNGVCHSGINRIISETTYVGDEDMKLLIQWPRNKYLNVWVCAEAGGAAGYSLYPGSVNGFNDANMDGIVIQGSYTGSIGTSNNYRSRVLTHEIGHWLNLRHPWGNSNSPGEADNCNQDDNVFDTPNTKGWTTCNLEGESCGSLDNVQNYMDYAYCGKMFTIGQKARLRAAALSSVAQRNQLTTQSNLIATGVEGDPILCEAKFTTSKLVICTGDSILFTDESFHDVNNWYWDFADGTTFSGSIEGVHNVSYHTYNNEGSFEVTLTAGNGFESLTSEPILITVLPAGAMDSPAVQGFESAEFPSEDWFIEDPLNDGGWEITTNASYLGSRSLHLANWSNDIEFNKDFLISSTMDLSDAVEVRVSYKWAYCFKGTSEDDDTDDRLRVSVTGDCGNDWDLRKMHRGYTSLPSAPPHLYPFVPSGPAEWNSHILVLDQTQYLTPHFRVMFEFESRLGNDIYLDNINITAYDSSMLAIQEWSIGPDWELYPNPSEGESILSCSIVSNHEASIIIYDAMGRVIETVFNGELSAGNHNISLSSINKSPGTYFVVIITQGRSRSLSWIIK
jgi:PKD repeat protein